MATICLYGMQVMPNLIFKSTVYYNAYYFIFYILFFISFF